MWFVIFWAKDGDKKVISNLEQMIYVRYSQQMEGYLRVDKNAKLNINHIYRGKMSLLKWELMKVTAKINNIRPKIFDRLRFLIALIK